MSGPLSTIVEACWAVFLIVWAINSFRVKSSVRRGLNSAGRRCGPDLHSRLFIDRAHHLPDLYLLPRLYLD